MAASPIDSHLDLQYVKGGIRGMELQFHLFVN